MGPRFDPRPGHGNFLRVRDKWRPTEITHMCIRTPVSLISSDSCTSENSRDEFNREGENVTGYRLRI